MGHLLGNFHHEQSSAAKSAKVGMSPAKAQRRKGKKNKMFPKLCAFASWREKIRFQ
jgi:hypothetical protein